MYRLYFLIIYLFAAIHNRYDADRSSSDVPLGLAFELVYGSGSVKGTISDETVLVCLTKSVPHLSHFLDFKTLPCQTCQCYVAYGKYPALRYMPPHHNLEQCSFN